MNKKGQLGGLQAIIGILVVVGILIAVGFLILEQFQDQVDNTQFTVVNESITGITNATSKQVASANHSGFNNPTITHVINASNGVVVPVSNYTLDEYGTIISVDETCEGVNEPIATAFACGYPVNVTYTYYAGEQAYQGIEGAVTAMDFVPSLLSLIILVAVVSIVLLIVFNVIPGSRASGA